MLVTSNFSFSHSVFKRLVLQTHKKQGLFGNGLISKLSCDFVGYGNVLQSTGNKTKDEMIRTGQMTPFGTVVMKEEADKTVVDVEAMESGTEEKVG